MSWQERALQFGCEGEELVGVLAKPVEAADAARSDIGVLVIVGGPQYRAGSHRQFVLLSRALAAAGHAVLRFDYRGMGDSSGAARDFLGATPDIAAALDAFAVACPDARRFVLWGLCDAASAALLYCDQHADPRIAGLCLLNPWVRSEAGLARAQVKHYYLQRLRQGEFWRKLLRGGVARSALSELLGKLRLARQARQASHTNSAVDNAPFQARMARGWKRLQGRPLLLILSGRDLTAKEFIDHAASDAQWAGLLEQPQVRRVELPASDHTFSTAAWRGDVEQHCIAWLAELPRAAKT